METVIDYDAVGNVLFVFLVLSVVFEASFTPIFNSTLFSDLHGKGVKIPLMIILSLLVFWKFDLDIISDLLVAMGKKDPAAGPHFMGQVMTAFLIAGGNDGIYRIYSKLGIRVPRQEQEDPDDEEEDEAPARK
jgi:hypothetical protein